MDNHKSQGHQDGGSETEIENATREVAPPAGHRRHTAAADGGWGWMCVLGCALSEIIFSFLVRAFGVTYLALLERYGESATATSWVGAINFSTQGFLGPVVSIFCRKFGCRKVAMTGGVLVVVGVTVTGYAPNIYVIYVTYGLMAGLGSGMSNIAGIIIIGQYFDKRKALAMSIPSFSSGVGALISAPILVFLLREYGFTGTFLILGGLCLNLCASGALYRPVQTTTELVEKQNLGRDRNKDPEDVFLNETEQKYPMSELKQQEESQSEVTEMSLKGENNGLHSDNETNANNKSLQQPPKTNINLDETGTDRLEKKKGLKARYTKLLKSLSFLALSFVMFSMSCSLALRMGVLPALVVDNGMDREEAAWLLSISGICSMISTLTLGPVLDVPAVRRYRLHIYNLLNLLLAATMYLFGLVTHYSAYITLCVVFAACAGVLMSQRATMVGDIVGRQDIGEGFGMVVMISAVGSLLGLTLPGVIKDTWGGYNGAFYLSGTLSLLSAVFLQAALLRRRMIHRNRERTTV